ncbi:bifunctional histidinol-phosphatase/imidazoleglycerol-phosphate dehydratase HisB [Flammeovirga kamogawensis]|uniref:Histidine biosynthesis bifunctional protein HisB n=1 Tax=Flammeovirga kamogawensis TaxID=373891 RepID=A0ABX8GRE6_9BACT|nr:bifunctional histidinol-phosphatase/imidazoleglycerol-phosphate dehydratase HisB [Flammeovirga kamogawensis]MBB6462783.1 imidazoleglycerol-phosphate dehydratase/histidinol-phosphatase [Flammeovirga kamogawensis]QWG05989.1 bifunctional histidinol-phosphatase/imidazoleglycerol-phosphate dehydratase HisB [Flammeovirga kamogawensis]TRX67817.1 bifunctional histidinol-phosphatase/imidazoleglycerol-phosphate dehydratase HisB [Flammeovirga kamogawensis]
MKKALFIDRDGTIIVEPPVDFQVDSLEKLAFVPQAISQLQKIATELDYELVMVTNQDGLGTDSYPEETFWPAHNKMLETLKGEGIEFDDMLIDKTFEHENAPTRKPRTGLMAKYMSGDYDLENSFVIGDRLTDIELAKNLGAKGIFIGDNQNSEAVLETKSWVEIYNYLKNYSPNGRMARVERVTNETKILIGVNLDGTGKSDLSTGIGFFDHMLHQVARHGKIDLTVKVEGDLYIDEHHTIEDTGLAIGEAFKKALGDKRGIARYGFFIAPMDEVLAQVALDFSGRPWFVCDAPLSRESVGDFPVEMFSHFFKSFSDASGCNLNIKSTGDNDHHIIEGTFKSFAKAVRMAIQVEEGNNEIPSTKGVL